MEGNGRIDIDISELRRAIQRVLHRLEETHGTSISIPGDYFWSVPRDSIFEVFSAPDLTIGQLSESWDNLADERSGNAKHTIPYSAVWIGDVLKAIGYTDGV